MYTVPEIGARESLSAQRCNIVKPCAYFGAGIGKCLVVHLKGRTVADDSLIEVAQEKGFLTNTLDVFTDGEVADVRVGKCLIRNSLDAVSQYECIYSGVEERYGLNDFNIVSYNQFLDGTLAIEGLLANAVDFICYALIFNCGRYLQDTILHPHSTSCVVHNLGCAVRTQLIFIVTYLFLDNISWTNANDNRRTDIE